MLPCCDSVNVRRLLAIGFAAVEPALTGLERDCQGHSLVAPPGLSVYVARALAACASTTALTQTYRAYSLQCARDAKENRIELSQSGYDFSAGREDVAAALFCFTGDFC